MNFLTEQADRLAVFRGSPLNLKTMGKRYNCGYYTILPGKSKGNRYLPLLALLKSFIALT